MKPTPRLVFLVVAACLFVSGMAGLVYEIVWSRYLALFLGHTSYAVVAVLVAFMGGLALGNWWIGNRADHTRRPLAFYAWIELGIGAYALAFPFYYDLCQAAFLSVARGAEAGGVYVVVLKFLFSLAAILFPTILMGGSLPLLARLVTRSLGELRPSVAVLYFVNSAGAVAGCVVADFVWIPDMGLPSTLQAGAALNLAAGAACLLLSGWVKESQADPLESESSLPSLKPSSGRTDPNPEEQFSQHDLRLALIGIGLSGFVAMLYEVAWTRLLALVMGSSTHAFSLMLITFITGIAVGAWLIYRWKEQGTMEAFAKAELALALTLFLSMFLYEYLPYWFSRLSSFMNRTEATYPLYEGLQALICFAVMAVPAICLGMTLPLASRIATKTVGTTGSSVGKVFAINTLGTVLGAAMTGLWFLPALGLARTFALGLVLNVGIAAAIFARHRLRSFWGWSAITLLIGLLVVWGAGNLFAFRWERAFSLGLFRIGQGPETVAAYKRSVRNINLAYYRDGAGSSVAVIEDKSSPMKLWLKVNGKTDASLGLDMGTQILVAHVPLIQHPAPKQVLVVGLGSGVTCGSALRHPSVERLDVVEISPEVAAAAKYFAAHNDNVLENPKTHLHLEDAKTFMQLTSQQYDVLISEPSNPWMAGVAGVFTREFYETCRSKLQPDGLMVQWIQTYETNDKVFDIMLATFASVFRHVSVWQGATGDVMLLGSSQPLNRDLARMERRFQEPGVLEDCRRMKLERFGVFLAHEILSPENAPYLASLNTPIHSDYYPVLEYAAQKAFFLRQDAQEWLQLDENQSPQGTVLLREYYRDRKIPKADYDAFRNYYFDNRDVRPALIRALLSRWSQEDPGNVEPLALSTRVASTYTDSERETVRLSPHYPLLVKEAATDPRLLRYYTYHAMNAYRNHRAVFFTPSSTNLVESLTALLRYDPKYRRVYQLYLAELRSDLGDYMGCFDLAKAAFDANTDAAGPPDFSISPETPKRVLGMVIDGLWRAGKKEEAAMLCQDAVIRNYTTALGESSDAYLSLVYRKVAVSFQDRLQPRQK